MPGAQLAAQIQADKLRHHQQQLAVAGRVAQPQAHQQHHAKPVRQISTANGGRILRQQPPSGYQYPSEPNPSFFLPNPSLPSAPSAPAGELLYIIDLVFTWRAMREEVTMNTQCELQVPFIIIHVTRTMMITISELSPAKYRRVYVIVYRRLYTMMVAIVCCRAKMLKRRK